MAATDDPAPADVALCIDGEVYARLAAVIQHLCVGLVDLNARVRLLSSAPQAEALTLGPIQMIVHQDLTWPLRRQRLRQIVEVLAVRPPTVVHAISRSSLRVAQAVAAAFDIDLVLHLTARYDVAALQRADGQRIQHVIAASHPLYALAEATGRVRLEAISLIRPGVLRTAEPTCFNKPNTVPALLCTADFEAGRGVDHLIHAVRMLKDRGHELLAFLVGSGSRERELRKLARSRKVVRQVIFARPKADPAQVMSGADIFVRPGPERAVTGNSLLAMATGTVVVTCAGGVLDHCVDGQNAIVCSEPSPEALADGIERLLSDHEYARTLAAAGQAHIKTHHSVSAMAKQTLAVYHHLAMRRTTYAMPT